MARIDSFRDPALQAWPQSGSVVLFDLEYTSWPGSQAGNWSESWEQREIVQIGAFLASISREGFTAMRTFASLVLPVTNPVLSSYFVELTGITQEKLQREGKPFPEAWEAFSRFCAGASQLWCVGKDGEVLRENFVLRGIDGGIPTPCFDIQPALARVLGIGVNDVISSRLPELAGLEADGRAHQALDDARAVLKALDHLCRMGKLA